MKKRSSLGLAFEVFPLLLFLSSAASIVWSIVNASLWGLLVALVLLYLLPPLLHRLHSKMFPFSFGKQLFIGPQYVPWWGSNQLQLIYASLPVLEAILRLVPGLYSAWLRLWGASIGRGVYWPPRLEIMDRSLLIIGDRVIFGYQARLTCHGIVRTSKGLQLFLRPIVIEDGALIGTFANLYPGVRVKAHYMVPAFAITKVNQRLGH